MYSSDFILQPLMALIGTKTDPSSKIRTLLDELEKALENKLHLVQVGRNFSLA